MSRRSIGRWIAGLAIAVCVAAVALLLVGDEGSPRSDASAPHAASADDRAQTERGAPPIHAPSSAASDLASTDMDTTERATSLPVDTAAAPITEVTDDDLRARLASGEAGMEVLASRLPETSQAVALAPRWQPGDEWLVETWYRQVQAHDECWSGPALWRFRVEREVSFRDEPCVEIVVTRADEPQVAPITMWVSRAGHLAGVETTVVQQGKATRSLYTPEPGASGEALRAPVTAAPLRLPSMGALATVAPPGLPFDRLPVDTPPDAPAPAELVGAGGDYLDIEFADPLDGTTVRQRWSPRDLRWPVVTRSETTLSVRRS